MSVTIIEDKGQHAGRHKKKHISFDELDVEVISAPLPVGDYILVDDKVQNVIERKHGRKKIVGKEMVRLKNGKEVERNIYEYGVELKKMDFIGTYKVCVDTKRSIEELAGNINGIQHERFRDECILAQNNGIQLYILVENTGGEIYRTGIFNRCITDLRGLANWKNPKLFIMKKSNEVIGYTKTGRPKYKRIQACPNAIRGEQLMKACMTMEQRYGVKFLFCHPNEAGAKIIELLSEK